MSRTEVLKSLHGRECGITDKGNLAGNGQMITKPAVAATITVAAENTNVRAISVVVKDINGNAIDYVETVEVLVFTDATRTAFAATGGSTGIAVGANGALLARVAKKDFIATTEADGTLDLTWTDTGTEQVAIGIRLPNGHVVMSDAFANT